jgi:hypothetical protein
MDTASSTAACTGALNPSWIFVSQEQVKKTDFGNPRQISADDVFDAGLGGRGHGDGVAIAAQAGVDPKDVDRLRCGICVRRRCPGPIVGHPASLGVRRLRPFPGIQCESLKEERNGFRLLTGFYPIGACEEWNALSRLAQRVRPERTGVQANTP